jgi:hypothetical protein
MKMRYDEKSGGCIYYGGKPLISVVKAEAKENYLLWNSQRIFK